MTHEHRVALMETYKNTAEKLMAGISLNLRKIDINDSMSYDIVEIWEEYDKLKDLLFQVGNLFITEDK